MSGAAKGVTSTERTPLLPAPANHNAASHDALAVAHALQIIAAGNFQPVATAMPPTSPQPPVESDLLMRTAQIIKLATQQPSPSPSAPQAPSPVLPPVLPAVPAAGKVSLELPVGEYVGEVIDGVPHGRGTMTYHPGNTYREYKGEWKDGKFHGRGELIYTKGDKFSGQWENGLLHGQGIQEFENGSKYIGQFVKGKSEGKGTMRYADGDKYVGDWKNDQKHGQGRIDYNNGSSYTGGWAKNKYEGQGKYHSHDFEFSYEGEWKNGLHHGRGVDEDLFRKSTGTFRNGKCWEGTWKGVGSNLASGTYKDGISHTACCSHCIII